MKKINLNSNSLIYQICHHVLLHCSCICSVQINFARIWKLTLCAFLSLPDITDHGWDKDGRIKWIQKPFPDDITEVLIFDNDIDDDSENTFENYGSDLESDSEEDESGD